MIDCPHCGTANASDLGRCSACGASLGQSPVEGATVVQSEAQASSPAAPRTRLSESSTGIGHERFAPGAVLLERYRILGQVGRGGMGEVYRAEDLTLGQEVALKFLPESFGRDEDRRRRFLQEAKLARQVAHPNVCRVYDVGEFHGDLFLSMEFIEGRDLASVLQSIGRLPEEKALDIARQLCAGLSALHERDLLHRDLKPANVMLDDRGRVRITDFGLTGVTSEIRGSEIRSGTPQYMAPEQLDGLEVTRRSDIYSLGLVLYEVFSGKAAIEGTSLDEITDAQRSHVPTQLRSFVATLDPAVERIVERCLEKDPARRPESALVVSLALPGGDPLAAALAMGETPSPELVAAAGGSGGLNPWLGLALLVLAMAGVLREAGAFGPKNLLQFSDLEISPDALQSKARDMLADFGYEDRGVDRARAFARSGDQMRWLAQQDSSQARWSALADVRPSPILFWYRESGDYLITEEPLESVGYDAPAMTRSGMLRVALDTSGRLVYFLAVPPETSRTDSARVVAGDFDSVSDERWDRVFEAAGFDRGDFEETAPEWIPDQYAMERRAWRGWMVEGGDSTRMRIEAGSVDDRPTYFRLQGPWSGKLRTRETPRSAGVGQVLVVALVIFLLGAAATLAVRNFRQRRADPQGAGRLAVFLLGLSILGWLLESHHVPLPQIELNHFFGYLAVGALFAVICLTLYLALEPFVRRIWPQVLIGSTRLLNGGWRDPMVGRSVLMGAGMFGGMSLLKFSIEVTRRMVDAPPPMPGAFPYYSLAGTRFMLAGVISQIPGSLLNSLIFLMLLVVLRLLLRRQRLAYVAFAAVTAFLVGVDGGGAWQVEALRIPIVLLWTYVLVREGVLAFVVGMLLTNLVPRMPLTVELDQFYVATSMGSMLVLFAFFTGAMVIALGGRSLLGSESGIQPPGGRSRLP